MRDRSGRAVAWVAATGSGASEGAPLWFNLVDRLGTGAFNIVIEVGGCRPSH